MHKRKMFRWLSTKQKGSTLNTSIVRPMMQTGKALFTLYSDIDELPLFNFRQCVVKNNLSALIVSGFPPEEELILHWSFIKNQYAEAIGDNEYVMYSNLFIAIEELQAEITSIETLISTLRDFYVKEFADMLNKLLIQNMVFDWSNKLQYHKQLTRCEKMKKFLETKMELKQQEFEAISDKYNEEGSGKVTNAYFTSYLIAISKQVGYRVSDEITVGEYCEYIKGFNEYVERLNQEKNGR